MNYEVIEKQKNTLPPDTITVENVGEVRGWKDPNPYVVTEWELHNQVDVLGPDFEEYDSQSERIVVDWDDTMEDTGKWWMVAHREVLESIGFDAKETTDEAILTLFGNIHV